MFDLEYYTHTENHQKQNQRLENYPSLTNCIIIYFYIYIKVELYIGVSRDRDLDQLWKTACRRQSVKKPRGEPMQRSPKPFQSPKTASNSVNRTVSGQLAQ